jgi:hypothetical protein
VLLGQAEPTTFGDVLLDLQRRRELVARREAIEEQLATIVCLETDVASRAIAAALQALGAEARDSGVCGRLEGA